AEPNLTIRDAEASQYCFKDEELARMKADGMCDNEEHIALYSTQTSSTLSNPLLPGLSSITHSIDGEKPSANRAPKLLSLSTTPSCRPTLSDPSRSAKTEVEASLLKYILQQWPPKRAHHCRA
ncbi:unnamed protein product, partial [Phaeothamnion confervicola]